MAGLKLSANRFLGIAKEATYGTPVTAGARWLPMKNPDTEEEIKYMMDNGLRGIPAEEFGAYQGVTNGSFKYDLDWFITDTPLLLTNILGPDTKTGTAAPYTHTFQLATGEPASMTIHDFDGVDQNEGAGAYLSQAQFKIDPEGGLSCSIQGKSFAPVGEPVSTPSFAAEPYFLGWETALTIGGSSNVRMVSMEITLSRQLTPRWSANDTQNPRFIFVGPLKVAWKMTFDIEDDTELAHFTSNDQPAVVATLTQPSTTNTVKFQMTKTAWTKAQKISSKEWVQVDASGSGLWNSTDAGPILVAIGNAQAASY